MEGGFSLERRKFADLPNWTDDDPSALLAAFQRCLAHLTANKPYKSGSLGVTVKDLRSAMEAACGWGTATAEEARAFFELHFTPFEIRLDDGRPGFVTAFYEPDVEVSATPDASWRFPFYRRPEDLIDLNDLNRPASLHSSYAFGRLKDGEISEYFDRKAIDEGALEGRGLEIAWAKSKADVFFAHVQGAARLRFADGSVTRITYAAKAGHPFSGIGRHLIELGEIPEADISMSAIRDWLARNPNHADEVYWHNRSYIFFREVEMGDPALGPVAAAKVQMPSGRALAVDRSVHTFGTPFYVASDGLTRLDGGQSFRRLMLALDTGSAIVGPARGDVFVGSGAAAGELAGAVRNDATFFILIPREAADRY